MTDPGHQITVPGRVRELDQTRFDKPWGYEMRFAITERYLGKLIHVNDGQALSLQYHNQKDETMLVTKGQIDLELEDEKGEMHTHPIRVGETIRILPGRRHRMNAVGDSEFFEVSSPEIDDVVRLEDRYGRAGT